MKHISAMIIFLFSSLFWVSSVSAYESIITINVNGKVISSDAVPFIEDGTTYVPLRFIEEIEGITIKSWDNFSKTLMINDQKQTELIVQVENRIAKKGTESIHLDKPPVIKNGRVMVPIRFIAEAFGSDVAWNSFSRTVYVARLSDQTKGAMEDADLTASRITVLNLPVISTLDSLDSYRSIDEGVRNLKIYFPEGKSDEFFLLEAGIISYYQVREHSAWIMWTAMLRKDNSKKILSFIPEKNIIKEIGEEPELNTTLVYYDFSTHAGTALYGIIDRKGNNKVLGVKDINKLDDLFPIEEEKM